MSRKSFLVLSGCGVAGLIIGTWGVVEALWLGLKATHLTSYVHWGLGVATYLYFIGLSAGALLCTLLSLLFGRREFDELAKLGAFVALVMEVCAGLAINLDLGHWERTYQFLLTPNPESPMFWMLVFYTAMLVVYALKLVYLVQGRAGRAKAMAWVSIPVSLLFYGINGVLFAILTNRPLWQGGLTPVLFVAAALLSGGALLALLAWLNKASATVITGLGRVLLLVLAIFLALMGLQGLHFLVGGQGSPPEAAASFNLYLAGAYWWSFWLLLLGLGVIVPLIILAGRGASPKTVAWASGLVLLGFTAARYDFVVPAQSVSHLAGLDLAFQHARLSLAYQPSLGEWLVSLWLISLGLLLFLFIPRWWPSLTSVKEG